MMEEYIVTVLAAGGTTLVLAITSIFLATIFGLLGAACKRSERRSLVLAASLYTTVARGIPDLVIMFIVFYSLPDLINQISLALGGEGSFGINPFVAGTLTLGLIFGSYMTETFRGALQAIPRGQVEAGLSLGMTRLQVFGRILLPQMARLAIPGFTNNWLVLIKATALVSLIGLHDLMFRARAAAESTQKPFLFYAVAGVFYLVMTIGSLLLLKLIAIRCSVGTREIRL